MVISGASSLPALSSAVVDRYLSRFNQLQSIRLGIGSGGRAAQTSTLGTDAIHFDGMADVFMSGEVNGNAGMTGSGGAASRFAQRFSLSQATTVELDMPSELGPRNNDYTFALTHENGEVV